MFLRRQRTVSETERPLIARGGVSGGPVLTGVVVAFGAMLIFSALLTAVLLTLNPELAEGNIDSVEVGLAGAIGLIAAQFLAYLWGGYTAGRMARGAGVTNGVLVAVVAIVIFAATGAVVAYAADAELRLDLPFNRLPVETQYAIDWGIGVGVAALVAMFVGAAVGGAAGAAWHGRLERETLEEQRSTSDDRAAAAPVTTPTTARSDTTTRAPSGSDTPPPPPQRSER